ncbi:MAG: flagellar basal body P-ring protein FlgI [Phycisphaeraceae bacterium]|nr:flagellar basal body P-ring protein FlgI [Phycisphaeraceae bacterium]
MRHLHAILAAALLMIGLFPACDTFDMVERADPEKGASSLERRNFEIDVQPIMRGTVASEAAIAGENPTIVRGYGLVVGLRGTGSRLMPAQVRSWMLQEMARRGVGNPATGYGDISPERLLDSEDTAVVVVEGVIPPGAVADSRFDVRVYSAPGTGTSSLEGGTLYTTDLRPGDISVGQKQATALAKARGQIFINPFAEPNARKKDTVGRLTGRIMDGGIVDEDMLLKLRMAVRSHVRAMAVRDAINSRFPREPGQNDETAHGKSGEEIKLTVPPSHHDDPQRFVDLVKHSSLRPEAVEATALSVRRALLANPGFTKEATLRWQALGPKSIPVIQDLYDYPEEGPRLASLIAGAKLDDASVAPHLVAIANNGTVEAKLACIKLLSEMGPNPTIEMGLRPLLDAEDVDIRLATFEALEERADPIVAAYDIDDKFILNLVPSDRPLIYVAQTGRPRIVIFGDGQEVERPMFLEAWSNRLLMKADAEDGRLEVFYREASNLPAQIDEVSPEVGQLVAYFGHRTTIEAPAPGIGLTYGETIGALHQLWREGYLSSDFKAEQDRVLAAILRAQKTEDSPDRVEFDADLPMVDEDEDGIPDDPIPNRLEAPRKGGDTVPR